MNLEKDTTVYGRFSAIIGSVAMIAWLVPLLGAAASLSAIVLGRKAINNEDDGWPIVGVTLGCLAMVLSVLRSGLVYIYG